MEYIVFKNERMPKKRISAFKAVLETKDSKPYMYILKDNKLCLESFGNNEIMEIEEKYLKEVYSDFIEVDGWYINGKSIKSYKPKSYPEKELFYIEVQRCGLNDLKIRCKNECDLNNTLIKMDELFNVI